MKVELINYTSDALNLLLRTKNTRLAFDDDPKDWDDRKKQEHLDYMRTTIKSSWEFVRYTFLISGVSRAFTHQLVRSRDGSYAQESQRTVDVRNNGALIPPGLNPKQREIFEQSIKTSFNFYSALIDAGVPVQDARGLLPTATLTSITAQYSLRALSHMAEVRLCTRTQGEYQRVFKAMKAEVVRAHPWAESFIRVACAQTGVCIFPRYKECPLQPFTYTETNFAEHAEFLNSIQHEWSKLQHEATPRAQAGKTMP